MAEYYTTDPDSTADFTRPISSIGGSLKMLDEDSGEYYPVDGEISYIIGPGMSCETHETTHLRTSSSSKTFIGGRIDSGLYEMELNWTRTSYQNFKILMNNRLIKNYQISLSNGVNYFARAFVKNISRVIPRAGRIYFKIQLKTLRWIPRIYATWDENYMSDGVELSADKLTSTLLSTNYENRYIRSTLGNGEIPTVFEVELDPVYAGAPYIGFAMFPTNHNLIGRYPDTYSIHPGALSDNNLANGTALHVIYSQTAYPGTVYQILWHPDGRVWIRRDGKYLSIIWPPVETDYFEEANPVCNVMVGTEIWPMLWLGTYSGPKTTTVNFGQNPWANTPPSGFRGIYIMEGSY